MTILDLLLDRVRSLTSPKPNRPGMPENELAQSLTLLRGANVNFGFSPALQAQLNAIPDMVRDKNGDRDYPDSAYGGSPLEPGLFSFKCMDGKLRPVRGLRNEGKFSSMSVSAQSIPLRKDLNVDRVVPSCPGCYYFFGAAVQPKCAVNPTGEAATCEHFQPS